MLPSRDKNKMEISVFAVVVTFNRANVLRVCLDSLLTQVPFGLQRIHVVVNSNDEATSLLLKSYEANEFLTYEFLRNPGPAGGFRAGLEKFLMAPQSHVWLMDDDVAVQDDCLKELVACVGKSEYVCPVVVSEKGQELGSYGASYGWWGILLSKGIVTRAGVPLEEMFYWAEDTEYLQHRIRRKHKVFPFKCRQAMVHHLHSRAQKRPSWYYYYVIRNTLYYRIYIVPFNARRLVRTVVLIPGFLARIVFREERKLRKILLLFYGLYHGIVGKLGKLVDPELNK
jgi:rhamnopyranosyl-N-acetylglucosaminyl-diphospho-decaprenol beta-1,3/1,4-galactofuranosyltransferase